MITGWLFDAYPVRDKIILWFRNNKTKARIQQDWTPSIYVASDELDKLKRLSSNQMILSYVKKTSWVKRFEKIADVRKSQVLKLQLKYSADVLRLAKKIQTLDKFGQYRLYNVDVPAAQSYFYEYGIRPLGLYNIHNTKQIRFCGEDDVSDTDYELPDFKTVSVAIKNSSSNKLARFSDKIDHIQIGTATIKSSSEVQMILDFVNLIKRVDPDFIITQNGDSFDFPYLVHRAEKNKIADKLVLGREPDCALSHQIKKNKGNSYFSYGQIHYKPAGIHLHGRIHIDKSNCFIWENELFSMHGLYEIAKTCMLPLQTVARASIGKCMRSIQFYNATKQNLLIPWKPVVAEIFKTRMELFIGDRGGLILEPRVGVYENVGELDFESLFGNIMLKKNISAETINCSCCPDSGVKVPELNYRICKKIGIVPRSLKILLEKRHAYSKQIKSTKNLYKKRIYTARKSALKWILVTSFGYLGFNNAKFGRIDAHMAVCAFARRLLLVAIQIAESNGFCVLHGIVDSIWVYKKNATRADYEAVQKQIEEETGFDVSLEIYRWIVFLSSKQNKKIPVPNRYYGALQNGDLKIRGIEARRHDTPKFFKKCQLEILHYLAACKTIAQVKSHLVGAKIIQKKYQDMLIGGISSSNDKILPEELAFTNRISKGTGEFVNNTIQADAARQLEQEDKILKPGQKIRYIISNHTRKRSKRVIPLEMVSSKYNTRYDVTRYAKLLDECCKSVLAPFCDDFGGKSDRC